MRKEKQTKVLIESHVEIIGSSRVSRCILIRPYRRARGPSQNNGFRWVIEEINSTYNSLLISIRQFILDHKTSKINTCIEWRIWWSAFSTTLVVYDVLLSAGGSAEGIDVLKMFAEYERDA